MAIAEMPGDADQSTVIMSTNFQRRLGLGADQHHLSGLQRQPIAIAQPYSLGQIDQDLHAILRSQNDPAAMAPP